jgi:hypothetical protein
MCIKAIPFILLLIAMVATSALAGPYYARGTFYAGSGETWGYDAGNELFDDGNHGDGAAGDGVFGAFVTPDQDVGPHEWKIATADWTENYPNNPIYPMANAVLFLLNPGDVIHFRLDTNTLDDGWQPATNAIACSHFDIPLPGYEFELIGSAPELGEWLSGIPVVMEEDLWSAFATIAAPGAHEYKFRVIGTWDLCNLGIHYNMFRGDNFTFETTDPLTEVRFEFNPVDGRSRAVLEGSVGVEEASWGQVKGLFR